MRKARTLEQDKARFATAADFLKIFASEMYSLFLLAFLLTADLETAEICFVNGLEECVHGMDSFPEWAGLWARRSIIKHAIRLMMPAQRDTQRSPRTRLKWPATQETNNMIRSLSALSAFERFAFVMSILEGYSDQDCTLLLGCRRWDFEATRARAIRSLSNYGYDRSPAYGSNAARQAIWLQHSAGINAALVA